MSTRCASTARRFDQVDDACRVFSFSWHGGNCRLADATPTPRSHRSTTVETAAIGVGRAARGSGNLTGGHKASAGRPHDSSMRPGEPRLRRRGWAREHMAGDKSHLFRMGPSSIRGPVGGHPQDGRRFRHGPAGGKKKKRPEELDGNLVSAAYPRVPRPAAVFRVSCLATAQEGAPRIHRIMVPDGCCGLLHPVPLAAFSDRQAEGTWLSLTLVPHASLPLILCLHSPFLPPPHLFSLPFAHSLPPFSFSPQPSPPLLTTFPIYVSILFASYSYSFPLYLPSLTYPSSFPFSYHPTFLMS